jgi:hypothetical protein
MTTRAKAREKAARQIIKGLRAASKHPLTQELPTHFNEAYLKAAIESALLAIEAKTIERCAKVAKRYIAGTHPLDDALNVRSESIARAILALKETGDGE